MDLEVASQLPPAPEPPPGRPSLARIAVWVGIVALTGLAVWAVVWLESRRAQAEAVRVTQMRALLGGPLPDWLPGDGASRRRIWAEVLRTYERHDHRPLWSHDGEPSSSARGFAKALADARRDGLDPADYGELDIRERLAAQRAKRGADPRVEAARLARLDARLTAAFVRFVRELSEGRVPAPSLDPDWLALRDTVNVAGALAHAIRSTRAARMVSELGRTDPEYRGLRDALRAYRGIEERGGWPTIPPGTLLKLGMQDERCRALRSRLAITGDLGDSTGHPTYDLALARAVRRYQSRQGLEVTGRLDELTRRNLNVSAADRRRTLELNLERLRWLPRDLPDPLIRVNIPESQLRVVQQGIEPLTMRVVVGSPTDPTPVFADVVTYLEFHPTWGIPKRILANEMLPRFRRDKEYFLANDMRVFDVSPEIPQEVDPRDVPWERVEEDSFPYIVRQDAGPRNPLGQVKFMCPNEYDVYLHDTPSRRHFGYGSRFLSHGCVRVQDPMVLASYLLQDSPLSSPDSMLAIMADSTWRQVGLKRRVPVLIEYRTAWLDEAGVVQFRPDVYGLDQRLDAALKSGRLSGFELNPKVLRNSRSTTTRDWATLRTRR